MITVATKGRSFKGCVSYHAHDKSEYDQTACLTTERVAWTHTRNLPTDDIERAWRLMAYTAQQQKQIKAAAGEALNGPAAKKPVYSLVLAWEPSQAVSKDEMLHAAESALKAIGLQNRQSIIFCHTDEPQPHLHIVCNRVCHLTGRTSDDRRDWLKLSKFAEQYERRTGRILCHLRANHNARRRRGEFVKNENLTRKEYEIVRRYMLMTPDTIRQQREDQQKADLHQLTQRHRITRQRFEFQLEKDYGTAREELKRHITNLEATRDVKGLFAHIVRSIRRITGALARRKREINAHQKSLASIDLRISEQRQYFERNIADERRRLEARHRAELDRDERLIALARSRSERDSKIITARIGFRLRSDPDQAYIPEKKSKAQLLSQYNAISHVDFSEVDPRRAEKPQNTKKQSAKQSASAPPTEQPTAGEPVTEKKWTRKLGRGANRMPGLKRHRTRKRG